MRLVLERARPKQRKSDFRTPLHVAVQRGLFEASLRLIELGADINAVAKVGSHVNLDHKHYRIRSTHDNTPPGMNFTSDFLKNEWGHTQLKWWLRNDLVPDFIARRNIEWINDGLE